MIDFELLSDQIHAARDRTKFITPPHGLISPPRAGDTQMILRTADLALQQVIAITNERYERDGERIRVSPITPFTWRTQTPTFDLIWAALEKATRAAAFSDNTLDGFQHTDQHIFTPGMHVRLISDRATLDAYGVNEPVGSIGILYSPTDEAEGPSWYVDFENGHRWYVQNHHLEPA